MVVGRWQHCPDPARLINIVHCPHAYPPHTCTYSTGPSSPNSFCALYLLAGNALGATRSNVCPRELETLTLAMETALQSVYVYIADLRVVFAHLAWSLI